MGPKLQFSLFQMVRSWKSICKRKIIVKAMHMLLKRGKTLAGKSVMMMLHHHHSLSLSCRSHDITTSFISPRDYEFSCSNTPVLHPASKYNNKSHHHYHTREELKVMRRVFDILEASPLPEFVRAEESPEQHQVDKDAEEFIQKFYKELKKQKRIAAAAALGSPSPYHEFMA